MTPEQAARWPGGREDEYGVVWQASDPFPTWFRWDSGRLILHDCRSRWKDEVEASNALSGGRLVPLDGHAYYKVMEDYCLFRAWPSDCGAKRADHPKKVYEGLHDFVPGATRWVRDDHPMLDIEEKA